MNNSIGKKRVFERHINLSSTVSQGLTVLPNLLNKGEQSNRKKRWRDIPMKSVEIHLQNIEDVKEFVNMLTKYECKFGLISGNSIIDPKSILGIFSLDLKKSMQLDIHAEEPLLSDALENIQKYLVCD